MEREKFERAQRIQDALDTLDFVEPLLLAKISPQQGPGVHYAISAACDAIERLDKHTNMGDFVAAVCRDLLDKISIERDKLTTEFKSL